MYLRDYFAAAILPAVAAAARCNSDEEAMRNIQGVATVCYMYADAMMVARDK